MKTHPIGRSEFWFAQITLFVAILLQIAVWVINPELTYGPHSAIVLTEVILAVIIGLGASRRHLTNGPLYRGVSFGLLGLISLANISSFLLVTRLLLSEEAVISGKELIVAAIAIFVTNIIIFALWYWELDSPGLSGRKWSKHDKDFHFTQQELVREYPDWKPRFVDYLYLSITNAISFTLADTKPLSGQAKMLVAIQAMLSIFTLWLLLARSVSILR